MKSSKNFQKSKKKKHFDNDDELRTKKVGSTKKSKYFKREIEEELDESEEFDLFGFKDDDTEESDE